MGWDNTSCSQTVWWAIICWSDSESLMEWKTEIHERNPVTVARQIGYMFKQLLGKVVLGGMHPIGQILNYDERREFWNRGTEHIHVPIHFTDAPRLMKVI